MSDTSQGPGWWQASDGKWYPPEQAPGGGATNVPGMTPAGAGKVDIGGSISYGWNKFTANIGPLLVAVLFIIVANGIVGLFSGAFDSFLLRFIVQLIGIAIGAVVSFGLVNMALKITRGETVGMGDVLPSGPLVVPFAITGIIVNVITFIGIALYIVPGIIAATFLLFSQFVVLDEGLQPGDAIKRSIDLVKGQAGSVFGFMVVAFLIMAVGVILCLVGLFVAWPLAVVAAAKVYKDLKGEPVAV